MDKQFPYNEDYGWTKEEWDELHIFSQLIIIQNRMVDKDRKNMGFTRHK